MSVSVEDEEALAGRGTAGAKVQGHNGAWCVEEIARRAVFLEQRERGGEREEGRARRGWRQMFRSLWASGRRLDPIYLSS